MFGKFIKALLDHNRERNHRPNTQAGLERRSKIDQGYISHSIAGEEKYQNPRFDLLIRYAKGFGMTLRDFIECYETFRDTGNIILLQRPRGRKKKEQKHYTLREIRQRIREAKENI